MPSFPMNPKEFLLTETFPLWLRWDGRLGGSCRHSWFGCVGEWGWLSEQSWKNVVIKFVSLWGRSCWGSWLNLCAMGQRAIAYNSSTDEQIADLLSAQISAHLLESQDIRQRERQAEVCLVISTFSSFLGLPVSILVHWLFLYSSSKEQSYKSMKNAKEKYFNEQQKINLNI